MTNTRVPPHSAEAEMAVLGSILIDREALEDILDSLAEEDFYDDAHRAIFSAARTLHAAGQGADMVTIGEELRRSGHLERAGGLARLARCHDAVATSAHSGYYANIVREKSLARQLIATATRVVQDAYSEEKPAAALLDGAQTAIMAVAQRQSVKGFASAPELMHLAVNELEALQTRKKGHSGLMTGYKELDRLTSGLHPGIFAIIAARPAHGKTALALNIASNVVSRPGAPAVAFFSLEMPSAELSNRLLSWESRINLLDLRRGYLPRDGWTRYTSAAARISECPIYVEDSTYMTIAEVRRRCRKLAADLGRQKKRLGLVVVDYIQLLTGSSHRHEHRHLEVAEISRGLKFLARDLSLPVIGLSQLNRRVEDNKGQTEKRPQLSDLRESGSLEQDADLVAFIFREAAAKPHDPSIDPQKAELIVAKQRQGPIGVMELRFIREYARFEPVGDAPSAPEPEQISLQ